MEVDIREALYHKVGEEELKSYHKHMLNRRRLFQDTAGNDHCDTTFHIHAGHISASFHKAWNKSEDPNPQ
jgi:hypothetical protein